MEQRRPFKDLQAPRQRHLSRWQRQRRLRRLIIALGTALVLLILALPAYGFWQEHVAKPRSAVTTVYGREITLEYLLRLVRASRRVALLRGDLTFDTAAAPYLFLDQLETTEILRQKAPELGITVSDREVEDALREQLLGPTPEGEAPPSDEEFQQAYQQYLRQVGMSDPDVRDLVQARLLREKVEEHIAQQVPREQEQVHVYAINTDGEEELSQVLERLKQGESFLDLALEYGSPPPPDEGKSAEETPDGTPEPPSSVEEEPNPGDLGWLVFGLFPALDDAIRDLEPGQYSEPVGGTTLYYVAERDPARPMEEGVLQLLQARRFQEWLTEQRQQAQVKRCFGQPYPGSEGDPCTWQYQWLLERLS